MKAVLYNSLSLVMLKARVAELETKDLSGLSTYHQNIIRAIKEARTEDDLHINDNVRALIGYNLVQLERAYRTGDYAATTNCINGELEAEDLVLIAGDGDEYAYMVGTVIEVVPPDSPNRETDNAGVDVIVDFTETPYSTLRLDDLIRGLMESFGGDIEEPPMDKVIFAPESLIRVTELDADTYSRLLEDGDFAALYCRQVLDKSA